MTCLSIVIPVFKTEAYLPRCLESILSQLENAAAEVEIWVVNDGSPDNSLAIMQGYREKYPELVHVIDIANSGVSVARNVALDQITGRYVWFVDSDDAIETGAIEELISIISNTNADYIYFNAHRVDENDTIIGGFSHNSSRSQINSFNFNAEEVLTRYGKHMLWLRLIRKDFIGTLRFPAGITHEDIHFDLQLLARKPRILILDRTFYRHFFDNPSSITNTMNPTKHRHVLWVYEDLYEKFAAASAFSPFLCEYIVVAITPLFKRACYLLSTDLSNRDKLSLFKEYCKLIRKLFQAFDDNKPRHHFLSRSITFRLIVGGYIYCAFILSLAGSKVKLFIDSISRRPQIS